MVKKITKKITKAKIVKIKTTTKIGAGATLAKIIEKKGAAKILSENGVPCLSCPMSQFEIDKLKIGKVCKMYGLNLEKILKDLNKLK
jgi:hypothetical protein